ncbi:hypothetical protein K461DRAFT_63309 [Myriangium duriaei CBS 260.36]|uniref:Lipoprotein n=1 Tax=Myriangium duriaei CBS 260.36 TaxID=1168546 RepID=A0A9P4ITH4_9PEZI|nr:hypothetical protein K461DRAFT_63309 [Myriangium duriaei CBS 260.36]
MIADGRQACEGLVSEGVRMGVVFLAAAMGAGCKMTEQAKDVGERRYGPNGSGQSSAGCVDCCIGPLQVSLHCSTSRGEWRPFGGGHGRRESENRRKRESGDLGEWEYTRGDFRAVPLPRG